jgi:hypothetical protein
MGLIERAQGWYDDKRWRFRYWYLDTRGGEYAQRAAFCLAVLVIIIELIRMFVAAAMPPPPGQPVKAIYWWIIQLIILVVMAAISYAMRPKPEQPKPQTGDAPTTEDGQMVKHHFGTCWIEDEFILAWKQVGTIKIKGKGGK